MRAACVREQVLRACGEFAEAVSVFRGVRREIAPQGHFLALRAQGATGAKRPRNDKSGNPGANIRAGAEKHFPRARV